MKNISAIILAAGSSSRLGRPKQLIEIQGKPMVRLIAEKCIQAGFTNCLVVLGCNHKEIENVLVGLPLETFYSLNWKEGMGTSLANGLKESLSIWPVLDGILICMSDQPFISVAHLQKIKREFEKGKCSVVSSGYHDTFGPPLICGKKYFDLILQFGGDKGAKSLFNNIGQEMKIIPCMEGGVDIDTKDDLKRL